MNKKTFLIVFGLWVIFYGITNFLFPSKASLEPQKEPSKIQAAPLNTHRSSDKFYVLENEFAQLVFSLKGGSISEINLPLTSDQNTKSLVRPIEFDKELNEQSPDNQQFPQASAYSISSKGTLELLKPQQGGYYPLIRRALIQQGATQTLNPAYYSAAIGYNDGRGTDIVYNLKKISKTSVQLEGQLDGKRITKTFSFTPQAPYCFDLSIEVEGDPSGLHLFSGIPEVEITSGSSSPTLKYLIRKHREHSVEKVSLPKESNTINSIVPTWVSNSNGYLGIIMNPQDPSKPGLNLSKIEGALVPTRLCLIDERYNLYPAKKYPGYLSSIPLSFVDSKSQVRFFAGPYEDDLLKTLDKTFSQDSYNPHYIKAMSLHGWFTFISEPFSKVLFWLMQAFYFLTKSWGLSIILLTIALRVMLYPLNSWSIKATTKMQAVAPEVQKIQEKYKKDPKKAQLEVVALYKQKGVNPLSGCLPLLIQLPFLIGMFDLLKSVFDLRGAVFIPGWINNLTAPDVIFSWSYPIPLIGTSFHLLPILLGVAMFYQQRMNAPKSVVHMSEQQRQQRAMGNIMTLVFTFMFYNFPSGLNLYWLSSMLLGIGQQMLMNKNKHRPKIEIIK